MLNNYDFNHTENNNEMENETNTYQPLTPSGSHNNNKKNPKNSKKLAKKIGAITLSAVLFGSVAAGSFQAVNFHHFPKQQAAPVQLHQTTVQAPVY